MAPDRPTLDSGNDPGNPLRAYRMSMLVHGFLPGESDDDWRAEDRGTMSYGVVPLRGATISIVGALVLVIVIIVAIAVVVAG